jgi:hypothetical protein
VERTRGSPPLLGDSGGACLRTVLTITVAVLIYGWIADTCLWAQAATQTASSAVRLAMIGASPGSARWPSDARWLALHRTPTGDRLEPVTARLSAIQDPCRGQDTVVSVTGLPADAKVPFLIHWDRIRAGPVESHWSAPRVLHPGETQPVVLKGKRAFTLAAYGMAEPGMIYNYRLVLSTGGIYQTIAQLHVVSMDGPPRVIWAGDLDRDDRVDLLVDLTTDYVGHNYVLYASSVAPPKQHVAEVARLPLAGC